MPRQKQGSTLGRHLRCPRCRQANLVGVPGRGAVRHSIQMPNGSELVMFKLWCRSCGNERVIGFAGIADRSLAEFLDEADSLKALKSLP